MNLPRTTSELTQTGIALLVSGIAVVGSPSLHAQTRQAVPADQIKDNLSPEEFRDYGRTSPAAVKTRIGILEFTEGGFAGGFPTIETADKLHDELDFHRATQAYLWALPIVSFAELLRAHEEIFQAKDGEIVLYRTPQAKR